MSSKIIVVSTRPPTAPLSGGMAPAVARACKEFKDVVWYAVGNVDDLKINFQSSTENAIRPDAGDIHETDVEGIKVKQIMVDPSIWDSHYNKVSNSQTWPLCHDRYDLTQNVGMIDTFSARYLNMIMAKELAKELKEQNDTTTPIWIHDYHHFSMPAFLRKEDVTNPIVFFNHIPLPDPDRISTLPVEAHGAFLDTLKSLAECDAVNFQTNETARRFMTYMGIKNPPQLDAYTEARFDTAERELSIGHYPISIDTQDIKRKATGELVSSAAKEISEKLTAPIKFTNFERADYSKGIEPRLLAYERLLQNHPEYAGQTQIVIGAEPTRSDIEEYRHYAERIREIAARINEHKEWYHNGNPPVILVYKQLPHADLIKLLPDTICTVTPYRDGMNLVSKEFVAAQDPNKSGVLILSSGAGSAAELTMGGEGALVYDPDGRKLNSTGTGWVNPRTPDEGTEYIYRAMIEAIQMPQSERNRRCARMQAHLETHDIGLWSRKHAELLGNLSGSNGPDIQPGPDIGPGPNLG